MYIIKYNIAKTASSHFLMLGISEDNFEEFVRTICQAKAIIAFNSMKAIAATNGYMAESEIKNKITTDLYLYAQSENCFFNRQ